LTLPGNLNSEWPRSLAPGSCQWLSVCPSGHTARSSWPTGTGPSHGKSSRCGSAVAVANQKPGFEPCSGLNLKLCLRGHCKCRCANWSRCAGASCERAPSRRSLPRCGRSSASVSLVEFADQRGGGAASEERSDCDEVCVRREWSSHERCAEDARGRQEARWSPNAQEPSPRRAAHQP
jgi:hypothetical protein